MISTFYQSYKALISNMNMMKPIMLEINGLLPLPLPVPNLFFLQIKPNY
jgi:hypothetical protein